LCREVDGATTAAKEELPLKIGTTITIKIKKKAGSKTHTVGSSIAKTKKPPVTELNDTP
jgi:hypothetical protein